MTRISINLLIIILINLFPLTTSIVRSQEERPYCTAYLRVNSVKFSPDGKYLLANWDRQSASLWELATGKEVHRFIHPTETYHVHDVAFSSDGAYIATAATYEAILWDAVSGEKLYTFPTHRDYPASEMGVEFTPDNKHLLTIDRYNNTLWELASGKELHTWVTNGASEHPHVEISPDGNYLLTNGIPGTVLWDLKTGKSLYEFGAALDGGFSPDGQYIFIFDGDSSALWEVKRRIPVRKFLGDPGFRGNSNFMFSRNGKFLLVEGFLIHEPRFQLWNVETGLRLRSYEYEHNVGTVAFLLPDSERLLITDDVEKKYMQTHYRIVEIESGKTLLKFTLNDEVIRTWDFSPDQNLIVVGTYSGRLHLLDLQDFTEIPLKICSTLI